MDRIIKFRGKAKYNEKRHKKDEWIYGDLRINKEGQTFICERETLLETEVQPKTVGQFTGLYDKNGKEIYEGDILQIDVDRAYVKWNNKYGYFQLIPIGDYYFDSDVIGQALEYLEAEVIGNIYDDKNLLEE